MDNRCISVRVGDVGEASAIFEFSKRGIPVSKPVSNSMVYDLIIDCNNKLLKVQVKTSIKMSSGESYKFDLSRLDVRKCVNKRYSYTKDDIDLYYLYCIEDNVGMLLPIELAPKTEITIRKDKYFCYQEKGVRRQHNYSIDYVLSTYYNYEASL